MCNHCRRRACDVVAMLERYEKLKDYMTPQGLLYLKRYVLEAHAVCQEFAVAGRKAS